MPYLTQRSLEGLRSYAYKPSGYTFLDNLHQPVWNWVTANVLPPWLAPNLITLMGVWALLGAYAVGAVHLPEFEGQAPRWLYFLNAASVFFYLHMDCLDGKQARRTKNSSPLGQLFDHGCDALALHLVLTNIECSLGVPMGLFAVLATFCIQGPFILAQWEEYHTGVMIYGNGVIGVTEVLYSVVVLHLLTGLLPPGTWQLQPFAALSASGAAGRLLPPVALRLLRAAHLSQLAVGAIALQAMQAGAAQILRVMRLAGTKQVEHTTMPKREHGHKQLGRAAAARHLAQLAALFALGGAFLLLAPQAPGQGRVAMATFGVTYALQATRLIMAHMAKEPWELALWPLVAMALQVGNALLGACDPVLLAYSINAVVVAGYLHYAVSMVAEICAFLRIPCLTVRKVED